MKYNLNFLTYFVDDEAPTEKGTEQDIDISLTTSDSKGI